MAELRHEVCGGISKVDGEVAHVMNVAIKRIRVLIHGVAAASSSSSKIGY
jgi:hypothetical protein